MARSALYTGLFFSVVIQTALPGLYPGSAFSGESKKTGLLKIFSGTLEQSVDQAPFIVIGRFTVGDRLAEMRDGKGSFKFEINHSLKGDLNGEITVLGPGQTIAFYPQPGQDYLLFLSSAGKESFSILSHNMKNLMAFPLEGETVDKNLPDDWSSFTTGQVEDFIHTAGHQSD